MHILSHIYHAPFMWKECSPRRFSSHFLYNWNYIGVDQADWGPVHTETFSCVFVLFTVLKEIENNQLIT